MRALKTFRLRLRSLIRGHRVADDLDEELRSHLERQAALHRAAGLSDADARHAAMRDFGNVVLVREQCRETWGLRILDETLHDLRATARTFVKYPAFTLIA